MQFVSGILRELTKWVYSMKYISSIRMGIRPLLVANIIKFFINPYLKKCYTKWQRDF